MAQARTSNYLFRDHSYDAHGEKQILLQEGKVYAGSPMVALLNGIPFSANVNEDGTRDKNTVNMKDFQILVDVKPHIDAADPANDGKVRLLLVLWHAMNKQVPTFTGDELTSFLKEESIVGRTMDKLTEKKMTILYDAVFDTHSTKNCVKFHYSKFAIPVPVVYEPLPDPQPDPPVDGSTAEYLNTNGLYLVAISNTSDTTPAHVQFNATVIYSTAEVAAAPMDKEALQEEKEAKAPSIGLGIFDPELLVPPKIEDDPEPVPSQVQNPSQGKKKKLYLRRR